MSALQFSLILILTCYTLNYEVPAISAEGRSFKVRVQPTFKNVRNRVASLEERLDALQKRVDILLEIVHDAKRGMLYEKQRRTQLEDELSHEKRIRTLLEERLDALQATVYNSTHDLFCKKQLRCLENQMVKEVNGAWSLWSTWTECTVTCGIGRKYRERSCTNPPPSTNGDDCQGQSMQSAPCSTPCPTTTTTTTTTVDLTMKGTNFADCWELQTRGGFSVSGVYDIYPAPNHSKLRVRCDMETDGGGWTVLQRRYDGSVNFNQSFEKYEKGFGDVSGEHWTGLEWMYVMTSQGAVQMRVDLCTFSRQAGYAVYGGFSVSDGGDGYRLHAGRYINGSIEDRLRGHDGRAFQTTGVCATLFRGGWWYLGGCFRVNLNGGLYNGGSTQGIVWRTFGGSTWPSLRSSEIKVRPLTAPGDPSRPYTCPP